MRPARGERRRGETDAFFGRDLSPTERLAIEATGSREVTHIENDVPKLFHLHARNDLPRGRLLYRCASSSHSCWPPQCSCPLGRRPEQRRACPISVRASLRPVPPRPSCRAFTRPGTDRAATCGSVPEAQRERPSPITTRARSDGSRDGW